MKQVPAYTHVQHAPCAEHYSPSMIIVTVKQYASTHTRFFYTRHMALWEDLGWSLHVHLSGCEVCARWIEHQQLSCLINHPHLLHTHPSLTPHTPHHPQHQGIHHRLGCGQTFCRSYFQENVSSAFLYLQREEKGGGPYNYTTLITSIELLEIYVCHSFGLHALQYIALVV